MKKRKFAAIAGLIMIVPLSDVFAQSAGNDAETQKIAAKYSQSIQVPFSKAVLKAPVAKQADIQWFNAQGLPTADARILLSYLQEASSHGLNPAAYKTDDIAALLSSNTDRSKAENLLTQALVDYVHDMTGPRINTSAVGSLPKGWRTPMTKGEILSRYTLVGGMDALLKDVEPKNPLYPALRTELKNLAQTPSAQNDARRLQVIVNMEKLRWDKARPARYIEVNLATQTLKAAEDGKVVQNINVIVGKTILQTAEFTTPITGVRFNPTWHVPPGIMHRMEIPELKKNPYALEAKQIHIYYDGKRIDPGTIDWNHIPDGTMRHITLNQDPGKDNALGQIRVLMEDKYNQYLHYTNQPELFQKKSPRTFSSGCMRMEEPDKIVGFILGISPDDIENYKKGAGNVNVKSSKPLSFYSVYHTITLGADGKVEYHSDIYGRDKKVLRELEKRDGIPPASKTPAPKIADAAMRPPVL